MIEKCGQKILLGGIQFYQIAISPSLGRTCRFYPSCSEYAHQAITNYGAWRGLGLAVRRLARCHPWHPGGYDPVPADARLGGEPTRR